MMFKYHPLAPLCIVHLDITSVFHQSLGKNSISLIYIKENNFICHTRLKL